MRIVDQHPEDIRHDERTTTKLLSWKRPVRYILSVNTRRVHPWSIKVVWLPARRTVAFYSQEGEDLGCCILIPEDFEEQFELRNLSVATAPFKNPITGTETLYILFIREGE